jgi:poly-gamma-glutamate synthesis protein (capsule biosynthesis protein)
VDFPFGGGTARVTGHGCCDPVYNDNIVPRYELTGGRGAVRRLFRDAELAVVNHEMPTTPDWGFHGSGFIFSGRPDLTAIFTRAGIDWVSLANNHIKDYGSDGIADTRRVLRRHGLQYGGAGDDLEQARRISYLEVGDVQLAIIPCVDVAPAIWAGPKVSGATPCRDAYIVKDIKRARRKADLVIVFPHWGVEYRAKPTSAQRELGRAAIDAGADMVIGNHAHWAGAMQVYKGKPIWYALGNFVFDQTWSEPTMEGITLELTFRGASLVQARMRPHIILDKAQPNFLDPAGSGKVVMGQVFSASKGLLPW